MECVLKMSDKRDRSRRRERPVGFDDHPGYFASQPPVAPPPSLRRSPVDAVLKCFDEVRGFGFVEPSDGSPNAFLHASKVDKSLALHAGVRLRVRVEETERGATVAQVLSVDAPASMLGTVKWYQAAKGFGFIVPDDGSPDIFIAARALQRLGIEQLSVGQRVEITVAEVAKGREARTLKLMKSD